MGTIPNTQNIRMTAGDNIVWSATITPSTDITNAWFTTKNSYGQSDTDAVIQVDPAAITITSGATATSISFDIDATQASSTTALTAGDYVYDVQFEIGGRIQTWFTGSLTLLDEATRRRA